MNIVRDLCMKKEFQGNANEGGIYKITNVKNGKIYIGSAKNFKKRAYQHVSSLRNQRHQNKHLQASWNKWGEDAFLFEVLEVVKGDKLARTTREEELLKEQIELQNWDNCFNFQRKPKSKPRTCFSNSPEETRSKLSEAQKRLWKDPMERKKRMEGSDGKRRERIGKAAKRVWAEMSNEDKQAYLKKSLHAKQGWKKGSKHTEETRKKMSEISKERYKNPEKRQRLIDQGLRAAKTYYLVDPNGNDVVVYNMSKFCRENGLRKQSMLEVGNGKKTQYKGWKRNVLQQQGLHSSQESL